MKKLLEKEVFERDNCPVWAKSAYVDNTGLGWYCSLVIEDITARGFFFVAKNIDDAPNFKSEIIFHGKYKTSWESEAIYDNTDWQNSAINR